jgi:exosome complex component RRP43
VHLTPLCAPKYEVGRPSEQATALSAFIKRVIVSSGAISFEDLCIQKGRSAWQLHADIICLDYDGNVIDASILALVAALKDVRLPVPVVQEDGEVRVSAGAHPYKTVCRVTYTSLSLKLELKVYQ